jgi:hypothetical protein
VYCNYPDFSSLVVALTLDHLPLAHQGPYAESNLFHWDLQLFYLVAELVLYVDLDKVKVS